MRRKVVLSILGTLVVGLVVAMTVQPLQAAVGTLGASWQATQRWVSSVTPERVRAIPLVATLLRPSRPEQSGGGQSGPTLTTDKGDYHPGDTVIVTGNGWLHDSSVELTFHETIDPAFHDDNVLTTVTDENGNIDTSRLNTPNDDYVLQPHDLGVEYVLTARGLASDGSPAEVSVNFSDSAIQAYAQCSNDLGSGYATGDTGCRWINGNLQSNNSTYFEGDATPQLVWMSEFVPGSTHTITLNYGTTKGGKHAYDFLTTWNWSESWITEQDRCQNPNSNQATVPFIVGCVGAPETYLDIPQDPNVPNSFEPSTPQSGSNTGDGARMFVMRGGTMTGATTPVIVSGSYAGDSESAITVSFTVASSGQMCSVVDNQGTVRCGVALWFGAHVAAQANWGLGLGAGSINGSPYHVSIDQLDFASIGQRDNQMQANVVTAVPNGTIIVVKDAQPNDPQDFNFDLKNNPTTIEQTFSLDDDADPTLPNSQTFSVPPGAWSVSELANPAGWTFNNVLCTGGTGTITYDSQTAFVQLKSSETVTCTFTNQENLNVTKGRIIVDKVTSPSADPTSFSFTATGTGYSSFSLTDTQTPNDSGPLVPGTYSVVENVPAGWNLSNVSCNVTTNPGADTTVDTAVTDVSGGVSIALTAGETARCTFTDTLNTGSLRILKSLSNPDSASVPASFTVNYDCGTGHTGQVSVSPGSPATVSGIPTGNTCSVTEVAPTAIPDFTWGTVTYSPASVVIAATGTTFDITVSNSITRNSGSLRVLKTLSNPDGASVPASFAVNYTCGTLTGQVSVSPGTPATVNGIPTGTSCSVTEVAPAAIPNFTWGAITYSPASVVIGTTGGTFDITVGNSITRDRGSLQILKTVSNPDGASVPASFTVNYNCGTDYTGQASIAPGSPATVNGIPTGNSCTVTEVAPEAIPGYTWGDITYSPASIAISTKGETFAITVGNSVTRDRGNFKISKTTSNPDGATLPTFTGTYNCGTGYTGTWSVASGGSQTVTGIPTGNSCSVTEDPLAVISGYTWATPTFTPASIEISTKGGTFEIAVANSITRDRGEFKITKTTSNPDGATLPAAFTGTYDCGTGYTGNWSVANGGSQTVSGIPTGNTCSVTENALAPISGYTWGAPTFTPSSIAISAKGGTFEIVVGNSITRDLGNFKITKNTSNPDGATLPAAFTGSYNCGTGYTGTWSVASGGSQTVTGIPTGNSCSVTEDPLAAISGYTWGTPTFTPSSIAISAKGGTFEIVVGNSITRDLGNFKITKNTSNPDGATLPAAFTGSYDCGTGYTGTWSVASGGSQTVTGIPTGNNCSVTENALAPISGYTWGTATFTPSSIAISAKGGTFEIVVGNSITRDRGEFKITKTTSNPDGATLPVAFTGSYDCGTGYTGTWSVANGGSQTVTGIPTGNNCSVTENALAPISGYTWGTATFTPSSIAISAKGGTFEIVVGNSITRDLGSFKISKTTTNPDGATLPAFTGSYNCGTGYTGTWSLATGGSTTVTGIPTGNSCSVTEDALATISGYTWGTPTFTPSAIVISAKGGTFEIVVGNSITRDRGSLQIVKTLSNPDGASVPASFTVNYNCGTGYTGQVSVALGSPATVNGIPTGSSCSVTEVAPAAIANYTWGPITYTPASVTISTKGGTFSITVGNSITRDRGSLQILKTLSNPDGASVPASFTVNYNCGTGYTGQVSVAPGSPATVNGIPTNVSCSVTEVAPAAITNFTWGTITYSPSSVSITSAGATVSITVGNSITRDRGKIVIIKNAKPQQGSFAFTTTGTGYNGFTLTGATTNSGNRNEQTLITGTYTAKEGTQLSWILTGIGGSTDPNAPYSCTITGSSGSTGVGDLTSQTVTIQLKKGDTVTCVFENTGNGATRTQGFWATHPQLAQIAWFGGTAFGHTFPGVAATAGIGDTTICGRPIDTIGKVMSGFWSDVSKKSTGAKRSSIDQAKMQLLQQMLAAELNASAFGSVPPSGTFAAWETALCGTNAGAIQTAQQQAGSFNSNGDSATFTPGTSADSKGARNFAATVPTFWDTF